jgi:hypothetical protein
LSIFKHPAGDFLAVRALPDKQPEAMNVFFALEPKEIAVEELEKTLLLNSIMDKIALYGTDKTSPARLLKNALWEENKNTAKSQTKKPE